MLREYAEKILEIYEDVDDIMIVSNQGIIEFYKSYRPELNIFQWDNIIGRRFLEIFPSFTEENSSVLQVLKSGQPVLNRRQTIVSYTGKAIDSICTTLPIKLNNHIIGVADIARYTDAENKQPKPLNLKARTTTAPAKYYEIGDIITQDPALLNILDLIHKVAKTDSSVMVYGKTGTGKELVAQALHAHSNRQDKPFLSQNCAAIPATLLEAILFGTVKGSFTGAEDRKGLFELAHGGTLFLDEINSMDLQLQSKILRAVEMGEVTRVGGTAPIPVDIRFVSALNEDPATVLAQQKIRDDLFYRLSVVRIHLPPLTERMQDIPLLTAHFIDLFNKRMNRHISGVSSEVEQRFRHYGWPGNVRELKNVIESAFNITDAQFIRPEDLPEYLLTASAANAAPSAQAPIAPASEPALPKSLAEKLAAYERQLILEALNQCATRAEAARLLKVSKQTLKYKMEKLDIQPVKDTYH